MSGLNEWLRHWGRNLLPEVLVLPGVFEQFVPFLELRFYERRATRDVRDDARTAGSDLIEAGQPLRAFKFDRRADRRPNLADLLRKSLGQEEPLRELGHAGEVFLTKGGDVVHARQKPVVA